MALVEMIKDHVTYLIHLNACDPAVDFAAQYDSLEAAWQVCEQGDWMLWLLGTTINCEPWTKGRKPLLACALDCAETVRELWPEAQREAIEANILILRKWIGGKLGVADAQQARINLTAAAYDAAAAAAADAAAAANAANAAYAAATNKREECAEIVRTHYPNPPIAHYPNPLIDDTWR